MRHAALVFVVALLASAGLRANPRSSPEPNLKAAAPVTEPAEMTAWLRRLVGSYTVDGMVNVVTDNASYEAIVNQPVSIQGKADCVGVGVGPGVQCILNARWQDLYLVVMQQVDPEATTVDDSPTGAFEVPGGVSYLDPSMVLFGLDPAHADVNYLLVNNKGLPEGGRGGIAGYSATFKLPCVNAPALYLAMRPPEVDDLHADRVWSNCERAFRIDAKADASVVHWSMDFIINRDPFTRVQLTLRRAEKK